MAGPRRALSAEPLWQPRKCAPDREVSRGPALAPLLLLLAAREGPMSTGRVVGLLALVVMTLLTVGADAQLARVGVVTTLQGSATLTRVSVPQGMPLKQRDDVSGPARIVPGDTALARILRGGRAVAPGRGRWALPTRERAHTATLDVTGGKIALAVVKERM